MKKFYPIVVYVFSLFVTGDSFSQPKIVMTLNSSGPKSGGGIVRTDLPALTPGSIYSFDNTAARIPSGGVCAGDGNWLYGVTFGGGSNNSGTFYRIQRNGTLLSTLYNLSPNYGLPQIPYYHTDGMVYFRENSDIRKYNTSNGSINAISANALIETKNLYIDADDWIYFAEQNFPSRLVKMKTDGSLWFELHGFNAATEGDRGLAGVTEVPGDSLFGVQREGGTNGGGTLYSIKKDGTGFFVHHQFSSTTGIYPESKLVYFDGKLFGTTSEGGNFDKGVLFCVDGNGTNYRVLYHFNVGNANFTEKPIGNISISSNGRIFGSFFDWLYNNANYLYLFKVDTSGLNFEPFFTGDVIHQQRINGELNTDILLLNDDEIFFPTHDWGRNEGGVLNHCDTSGTGSDLYHYGVSQNGFYPTGGMIKASDGKLYGTARIGGSQGNGVIFSVNADGSAYTRLYQLTDADGYEPSGKLLEASDGKLYGACRLGGAVNTGCIFRINKNGTGFQVIYSYITYTGGYSPVGGLIEGTDGSLYGINFWPEGSVFKINKDGSGYTELKVFTPGELTNPYSGVRLAGNYLYGTCGYGGAANKGGVYRVKTNGTSYQVLHEFDGVTDGDLPTGTPLIASNGKLYGTTAFGGSDGNGYLFRVDTTGANYTVLRDLSVADGGIVWGNMIQASDGLIYGGTFTGGTGGAGTVFKMNLDGSGFSVIKNFDYNTEGASVSSLLDLNGNFTLPVELLSFNAEKRAQTVLLTWKTAQEQNSDRFEIERSSNGTEFTGKGSVAAAGNTNSITNYSFKDIYPMNGVNYYRLKQMDKDGSFTYSRTVSVSFDAGKNLIVFPNPVSDRLYIRLPQTGGYTAIRIVDASGKLVIQQNITQSATHEVNIQSLPKGWYILQLIGDRTLEKTFLKE